MKHFFESIKLNSDNNSPIEAATALSDLKPFPVIVNVSTAKIDPTHVNPSGVKAPNIPAGQKDPNILPLAFVHKPYASYTTAAREGSVKGRIRLRVTFAQDGFISRIEIIDQLAGGLVRQAVFAAMRIKFLPEVKSGAPTTVIRPVEYTFDIY